MWKIAFPLLIEPWSKTPCLVIMAVTVEDARPGVPPSFMDCIGLSKTGQHYRFKVPIRDFEQAARAPVTLQEAQGILAPSAKVTEASILQTP